MGIKINPEKALEQVNIYLDCIEKLLKLNYKEGSNTKSELDSKIKGFLESAFENGGKKGYSSSPPFFITSLGHVPSESEKQKNYISSLHRMKRHLIKFKSEIETSLINNGVIDDIDAINTLELIFSKFHDVVRQLRKRYDNRDTLDVSDEYDVQDLLHSLLKMFFSDIRAEEVAPSYAGNHRRIDFVLKSEKIAIEVKMTRSNLKNREVSKQLNDDIASYKTHPDSDTLICFIYDPEGWIDNPIGFEQDVYLQSSEKFLVKAFIFPK